MKQKSCGISRGVGFWLQNFQGLQHNFAEFTRVEFASFFVWYFYDKVKNVEIPRIYLKKLYPQPPAWVFLE